MNEFWEYLCLVGELDNRTIGYPSMLYMTFANIIEHGIIIALTRLLQLRLILPGTGK